MILCIAHATQTPCTQDVIDLKVFVEDAYVAPAPKVGDQWYVDTLELFAQLEAAEMTCSAIVNGAVFSEAPTPQLQASHRSVSVLDNQFIYV